MRSLSMFIEMQEPDKMRRPPRARPMVETIINVI
jgi:hypothetical protein